MHRDIIRVGVRNRKNYYSKQLKCVCGEVGQDKLSKEWHGALLLSLPLDTLVQPRMATSHWHTRKSTWRAPETKTY